jgi:hypothetical protein
MLTKEFRSWSEFVDAAAAVPDATREIEFGGVRTRREALALARNGWPEGMRAVHAIAAPVLRAHTAETTVSESWAWDVTGANYEVGEYLSGVPECWITPELTAPKPTISIAVNMLSSYGVSREVITTRGAGIVALVLALQQSGYAVRCFGMLGTNHGGGVWMRIPFTDDDGGPLDVDRIVYALAHPSTARLLGYYTANELACPGTTYHGTSWSQGTCPWSGDVTLGEMRYDDADFRSVDAVSAWLARTMASLTAPTTT